MAIAVLVWAVAVTAGIVAWVDRSDSARTAVPPPGSTPTETGPQPSTSAPSTSAPPTPESEKPEESEPKRTDRPSRSDPTLEERPEIPAAGTGEYERQKQTVKPSSDEGEVISFDVRVEKGLPYEAADIAKTIHQILDDERSWTGTGNWRFKLVGPDEHADLHAYLVTPETTDRLCAPLQTNGKVSCRNGDRIVLNARRWAFGADAYGNDLTNYRRYLVNHEFGHALGFGHVDCPGEGQPAPIMLQQTKGLDGCRPNPWPAGDDD